jgi:subtilisin family serine protease
MRLAVVPFLGLALAVTAPAPASRTVTLRYSSPAALRGLDVTLRVGALHLAEVRTNDVAALRARPGIRSVRPPVARHGASVGTTVVVAQASQQLAWQYAATRRDLVPPSVLRAAARITIAVIDTGADLSSPDLAPKNADAYSVVSKTSIVTDLNGHGTFVASIAGGSGASGGLVRGFGGDARLMIVQANRHTNDFTDANEAAAIVWAVDHGAQIVNLSLGGRDTSQVEQDAVAYAVDHGVLLVAAAGNEGRIGNQPTYPAALLRDVGLAVAGSTRAGTRAPTSTAGAYVALAAPGVEVLGAMAATGDSAHYGRAKLPGLYGYGTGTSYAAPQVAGAAALVWGANPHLTAAQVMQILKDTARGNGTWNAGLGYGVLDVAASVARAAKR